MIRQAQRDVIYEEELGRRRERNRLSGALTVAIRCHPLSHKSYRQPERKKTSKGEMGWVMVSGGTAFVPAVGTSSHSSLLTISSFCCSSMPAMPVKRGGCDLI